MVTITAAELQNHFGRYRDLAQRSLFWSRITVAKASLSCRPTSISALSLSTHARRFTRTIFQMTFSPNSKRDFRASLHRI